MSEEQQSSSLNSKLDKKSQHEHGELSRDEEATGGGPAPAGGVEPQVEGEADNGHASIPGCQKSTSGEEVGSNEHDSTSATSSVRKSFGESSSSSSPMEQQQRDQKRQPRPLLKRVGELELNLRSIEDKYSPRSVVEGPGSPRTSCLSTPSSIEARRRPISFVLEETEEKGTLVERVSKLEERVESLSMQLSSAVPVLKSPPSRKDVPVSDMPAVEKHEVPAIMKVGNRDNYDQPEPQQLQQNHNKLNKKKHHHHKLPMLFKSCIHSSE